MSESAIDRFIEAAEPGALEAARGAISGGEAPQFAEGLLSELAGETTWRRERALERLARLEAGAALFPHLRDAIRDGRQPRRRNAARSALARLAAPDALTRDAGLETLAQLARRTPDADVRLLATTALGESGNGRARETLEQALSDPEPNVAAAAAEALGILGDGRAVPALAVSTRSDPIWVRTAAALALGRIGDPRGLPALDAAMREPMLAGAAATAVGEIGDPAGIDILRPALEADGEARIAALRSVGQIYGGNPDLPVPDWLRTTVGRADRHLLSRVLRDHDPTSARLLGIAATPEAAAALARALEDPDTQAVAAIGIQELPVEQRRSLVLERLPGADRATRTALLNLLPALNTPESIRTIIDHLGDEADEARAAAAEVFGRSDPDLVLPALADALDRPELRVGVTVALGRLGSERCPPLTGLLDDSDPLVRAAAADGLARCGTGEVDQLVGRLSREDDTQVRQSIIGALGDIGAPQAVQSLAETLRDPSPSVRFAAARALGRTRAIDALEPLLGALADRASEVRIAALSALGELGDARAAPILARHLRQPDRETRRTAASAISHLSDASTVDRLTGALSDPDREVRLTAVETLRRVGGSAAEAALERRAENEADADVRKAVSRAVVDVRERRDPQQG
ncbi:MAG: HEAT repeat domain-containing protein [Gemmatimonadota bacterium]